MGAGTSRSGSAANLNDAGAFVRQQEQKAAAAREKNNIGPTRGTSSNNVGAFVRQQEQKAAAQKQYAIDQRSQYENLPQSLRDKVSFEDAYADRGPAAAKPKNNTGVTRDPTSSEYFDLDKFNRLKAEVDQQRSRENAGIAFGPGRSNRGYVDLGRMSRDRMRRGNR